MRRSTYLLGMMGMSMVLLLSGCKKKVEEVIQVPEEKPVVVEEKKEEPKPEEKKEEVSVQFVSPISGLPIEESQLDNRVVAVMLDNHPNARWQAGVREAGIIYEIRVEGSFTRYMALYLEGMPSLVGPIRSARPYFLDRVLEYGAEYVHFGGSEQALAEIPALGIFDIDGLTNNTIIWRYADSGKVSPHNAYATMEGIRQYMTNNGLDKFKTPTVFQYYPTFTEVEGSGASQVHIYFNETNSTDFIYRGDGFYTRFKDGVEQVDENDQKPLDVRNIIIQVADSYVIDGVGHLANENIGSGTGKLITAGKVVDITWEKSSREAKTTFFDVNHNEIILNPGQTWIEVIDTNTGLEMN